MKYLCIIESGVFLNKKFEIVCVHKIVMPVYGLIHGGKLRACPCAVLGLMYDFR